MRCVACNVILTPQESTRRFAQSLDFVDLCNKCLGTIEDEDLQTEDGEYNDDEEYDE